MILGIDGRLANASRPAGAGHYCRELLQAMNGLDPAVALRVYLDAAPSGDFPSLQGDIRVLPDHRFWTHRALSRELRRDPPGVFFSPVTQMPWRCPCPALVSVLDLAVRSHPDYFPWRKRLGMALKTAHAIRHGSHFIAISESTARDLETFHAIARARITVAHLGVSSAYLNADTAGQFVRPEGLPERYVLHVGQLQPRKNLVRLVEAFAQVCDDCPELPHHLVLAGPDGWQQGAIHQAINASPVAHRIHRLGYVPEGEMPGLMAGADVLALVSLHEGFGLPALEAMAAGTAVLASNCSSLPEVVGEAGLLVDPRDTDAIADGLRRLLTDEAARSACARLGKAQAQRFRWEHAARAVMDAAKALAANETPAP